LIIPKSINEYWDQVQDAWNSNEISFIQTLYNSIPERIKSVIHAKGDTQDGEQ
jgi:hypothetical protein